MRYERILIVEFIILLIIIWNIFQYTTLFRKSSGLSTNEKTISFIANLLAAIIIVVLMILLFYSKNKNKDNKEKISVSSDTIPPMRYVGVSTPRLLSQDYEINKDYEWKRYKNTSEGDVWYLVKRDKEEDGYNTRQGVFY